MKNRVFYFDRKTQSVEEEKIYGSIFLEFLYGNNIFCKIFSKFIRPLFSKIPYISQLYGLCQKAKISKKKIIPFIEKFQVDSKEFLTDVSSFNCFNDFFIRELKSEARPVIEDPDVVIMPADARYLVIQDLSKQKSFFVKGQKFNLGHLLKDKALEKKYKGGSLALARLCPTDYHRFHFPCEGFAQKAKHQKGWLYSVNPLALRKRLRILWQNKRMITELKTDRFGDVLYIEVGATFVGSIKQTYQPETDVKKGQEKGYFEFGGSSVILLFEKGKILFDEDLRKYSQESLEVRGFLGQSLARSISEGGR